MKFSLLLGFLSIITILAGILLFVSFNSIPRAPQPTSQTSIPNRRKKLIPGSKAPPKSNIPLGDPKMQAMRLAVKKYALKNPGLTAQVMQEWVKKKP